MWWTGSWCCLFLQQNYQCLARGSLMQALQPGSPWQCCTLRVYMPCPWWGEGEAVLRGPAHCTFPNPGPESSPARFPEGNDWHVLGWWHQRPKTLHSLSDQAQGSQNSLPFPRSILSLVLLILGQLSRRGGKKEEEEEEDQLSRDQFATKATQQMWKTCTYPKVLFDI